MSIERITSNNNNSRCGRRAVFIVDEVFQLVMHGIGSTFEL